MSLAYLRSAYGIPAKKGMRVKLRKAYFTIPSDSGVITGSKHAYIRIRIDGSTTISPQETSTAMH